MIGPCSTSAPSVNLKGINASRIPDASHSLYGLLSPPCFCTLTPRYTSTLGEGARQRKAGNRGWSYICNVSANPRGHFQRKYNNRLAKPARSLSIHLETCFCITSASDLQTSSPLRNHFCQLTKLVRCFSLSFPSRLRMKLRDRCF